MVAVYYRSSSSSCCCCFSPRRRLSSLCMSDMNESCASYNGSSASKGEIAAAAAATVRAAVAARGIEHVLLPSTYLCCLFSAVAADATLSFSPSFTFLPVCRSPVYSFFLSHIFDSLCTLIVCVLFKRDSTTLPLFSSSSPLLLSPLA